MSLCKAIQSGKEHRKPYGINKQVDVTCRNHGGCLYCLRSRTYRTQKELEKVRFGLQDSKSDADD